MADTLTRNSTPPVVVANLVAAVQDDYSSTRRVENILHPRLNGAGFNVTYKPPRLRSGTLPLLFATAAQAHAALAVLAAPNTFTLAADLPAASMTFVVANGELEVRPDEDSDAWVLAVPYQEV